MGFVDVAGADFGDAFGSPAYDTGDLFVGQALAREEGDAQIVDGAIEAGGLAALPNCFEAAFRPLPTAGVDQDGALAVPSSSLGWASGPL
ncbi:hypothetical protein [Novosphingobium sp. BL-52-GroH]|uniref:hypothetical protein n=1 Tax=Novosphingobium sp. BL-52-GroH TaxID=3349877 RepID=UPI00384F7AB2